MAAALDHATVLVLPSWPEGLGLVVIEAFARGRGVVVTAAGGLLDLVDDGVEGILIPRADTRRSPRRSSRVLTDRDAGGAARRGCARPLLPTGTRRPSGSPRQLARPRRPHDRALAG